MQCALQLTHVRGSKALCGCCTFFFAGVCEKAWEYRMMIQLKVLVVLVSMALLLSAISLPSPQWVLALVIH